MTVIFLQRTRKMFKPTENRKPIRTLASRNRSITIRTSSVAQALSSNRRQTQVTVPELKDSWFSRDLDGYYERVKTKGRTEDMMFRNYLERFAPE